MNEKKREGVFIPCGDSLERMQEISEEQMENVSGGAVYPGDEICSDSEQFETSKQITKFAVHMDLPPFCEE